MTAPANAPALPERLSVGCTNGDCFAENESEVHNAEDAIAEWEDGTPILDAIADEQIVVASVVSEGEESAGTGSAYSRTLANELVRRYNAHAALVEACEALADRIRPCESCDKSGKGPGDNACRDCGGVGETLEAPGEIGQLRSALAAVRGGAR